MATINTNSLISIIIPAYNAERYLSETIESVLQQTYTNWELIIVNDGSTDATSGIITNYADKNKRIRYVTKKNTGVSDTRNEGIKEAKGDYVFFLDADDIWLNDYIEQKLELFKNDKANLVYSACNLIDENSKPLNKTLKGSGDVSLNDLLTGKGNYITAPSGISVTSQSLKEIGGFDINLSNNADQDLFMRYLAAKKRVSYVNKVLWLYRVHNANMSKNVALLEKDTLYLFNKAEKHNLFSDTSFKKICFSKMYLLLAGSWWKNGNSKLKGLRYVIKAFLKYPPSIFVLLNKK